MDESDDEDDNDDQEVVIQKSYARKSTASRSIPLEHRNSLHQNS